MRTKNGGISWKLQGKGELIMIKEKYFVKPIGKVNSPYIKRLDAPKQGNIEDKTLLTLEIFDEFLEGASDIHKGEHYLLFFIFDQLTDYELRQHPCGNENVEKKGVFSMRTPFRPNFIGITEVEIVNIDRNIFEFYGGDMLDGTPVIDIKPVKFNKYLQNANKSI